MSNALIILLGGIGASVSWGISDYFSAHSAKKIGPMLASAAVNAGGALLFIAIYFIFYKNHTIGDVSGVILSVAAGITLALGDMAFFKGLKKGPVSIVSPLSSLYPLVTTVMAIVAFSAIISSLQGQ